MSEVLPTTYGEHGHSAAIIKARKPHYCSIRDHYPVPCLGRIEPGTRYIRSVMFPNHDVSGYDVPVVNKVCVNCAYNYTGLDGLARTIEATS